MTDIGDDVTVTTTIRVAGTLTNPSTVTLTVTSPSGTTTTPTVNAISTGIRQATFNATEAGRWRWTWTTTGPASKDHGYIDISADPPSTSRLDPLATVGELEYRLGRPLTDAEAAKAPGALAGASSKIRGYTKLMFDAVADDTIVLRPVGTMLRLPQRPVLAVSLVEMIGTGGTTDLALSVSEWHWDGIDKIELFPCDVAATGAAPTGAYANTYRVTYDHGGTTPDFIVDKACDVALRVILSPTQVEGLVSEHIGKYGYNYGQFPGGQSPGASARLTKEDKQELREAGYRKTASTIQLVAS